MSFAIINRSFWPESEILGEAHLRFAEKASKVETTCVIFQTSSDIVDKIKKEKRGENLKFRPCKSFTDSSSNLVLRVIETLYFLVWVFICLISERPKKVYVSTDPPILVPYIVFVYTKLFKAEYFYHIQDIHPEATNIVMLINKLSLFFLRYIDNVTIRYAKCLITISKEMKDFIRTRSGTKAPIILLDNPALQVKLINKLHRKKDFVFCGNLGRLQHIPLLIAVINRYLEEGGNSSFTFIGSGVYSSLVERLAKKFNSVEYLGKVCAEEATIIVSNHRWALLSIQEEATNLAFPSKSSTYVMSGCNILAISGIDTSISKWITKNNLGIVSEPHEKKLVDCFFRLENEVWPALIATPKLQKKLNIDYFVNKLLHLCEIAVD